MYVCPYVFDVTTGQSNNNFTTLTYFYLPSIEGNQAHKFSISHMESTQPLNCLLILFIYLILVNICIYIFITLNKHYLAFLKSNKYNHK